MGMDSLLAASNPGHDHAGLSQDLENSSVLPCRLSVCEANGRTVLATIKPTALVTMLNAL